MKKVNLMLQYKNHHIRTNTDTIKDRNKKNLQKSQVQQNQTQKSPQVEPKRNAYIYEEFEQKFK